MPESEFNDAKQMVIRVDLTGDADQLSVSEALHELADDIYNGFKVEPEYGHDDTNPIIRALVLTGQAPEEDLDLGEAGQYIYRLMTAPSDNYIEERLECLCDDMYGGDLEDTSEQQRLRVMTQFVADELGADPDDIQEEDVRKGLQMAHGKVKE